MSTYLVTGGCGFIGSHLVDALLAAGHHAIVIDNLSSGKRENLATGAELIVGDVCDKDLLADTLPKVDGCFHLAARVGIASCQDDWVGANYVNLVGTLTLLEAARLAHEKYQKIKPVVYASSSAVYGDSPEKKVSEASLKKPLSSYGADKLACELHSQVATLIHGVPTIGLRLFNVYGPRQNPSSIDSAVIPIFVNKIRQKQSIKIYGDGQQTRDFIYVADVVNHFIFYMQNIHLAPEVFNVCTGKIVTINDLADLLGKLVKQPVEKVHEPARPGDILHSCGNPEKSKKSGVFAKTPLEEGVEKTLLHWED